MSEPPAKKPSFSTKLSGMAFMRRGLPKELPPVAQPEIEVAVTQQEDAFGAPLPAASCTVTYEPMPPPAALSTRMSFKGFNATTERVQAELVAAAAAAVAAAKARSSGSSSAVPDSLPSPSQAAQPHTTSAQHTNSGTTPAVLGSSSSQGGSGFLIPGELQALDPGRRLGRKDEGQGSGLGEEKGFGSAHVVSLSGPANDGNLASLSKKRKSVDPAGAKQQQQQQQQAPQGKGFGDANMFASLRAQKKK
ncbi:MAG: hypothetical protein WDW38_008049 [Sanguina aurantia]